ncbi:MAG: TonB family protein [Deltaproteobacteria bacterium]|nr:TonB family protein [Deltaproteobacteria bacterium]
MICVYKKRNKNFIGGDGSALLVSLGAHALLLGLLIRSIDFEGWDRAAGRSGAPGALTEVSLWFPAEKSVQKTNTSVRHPTPQSALNVEEITGVETAKEPEEGATKGLLERDQGRGSGGNFGAGGRSLSYRALLHSYLDQSKSYPPSLRELGLSGSVRVQFRVTREGTLVEISVPEQEALMPLKTEALRFLKRQHKVPLPPSELSESELRFELPLRYEPSQRG